MSLQDDDDLPDFDGDASQPEEEGQPEQPPPLDQHGQPALQSDATELPLADTSATAATTNATPGATVLLEPGTVRVDWPVPFTERPILEQCTVNAQVCFLCEIPALLHDEAHKAQLSEQLGPALGQIRLDVWHCLEMIQHTFAADLQTEVWEELWHEAFAGKKGSEWRVGTTLLGRFSKHTTVPQNLVLELLWKVIHCFRKAVADLSAAWKPVQDQVSKKKHHAAWNGLLVSVLLPGISNTPMAVAARQSTASRDGQQQPGTDLGKQQRSQPAKNHEAKSSNASQKPERSSGGAPQRTERSQHSGKRTGSRSAASTGCTHQQKIGIPPPPRRCPPSAPDGSDTDDTDDEETWGQWRPQGAPRTAEKATDSKGAASSAARIPYPFGPMQTSPLPEKACSAGAEQEPVPKPKKRPKLVLSAAAGTKAATPQEQPLSSDLELPSLAQTWEHFGRAKAAARKRCHSPSKLLAPWRQDGQNSLCVDPDTASDEKDVEMKAQAHQLPARDTPQQIALPKFSLPPTPPAAPCAAAVKLPGRPPVSPPLQRDHRVATATQSPWRAAQSFPPPPPPPPPP
eukprot:5337197-Amphidinium_carterae.4